MSGEPKEAPAAAPAPGTVGQMPVGLAGLLEVGKTGGIGMMVLAVVWSMLQTIQDEQARRLDGIESQIGRVQADMREMQTDLGELKGDLREISVRQLLSEEERHRAQPPPK